MILPAYHIADSRIPGAGRGLFLDARVARGRILVAPDAIPRTLRWSEVLSQPDPEAAKAASVRWFEDHYTVSADWPDECYVNHSFRPNGLWHLGFIFAARDIAAGEELTVDYRHLLPEGGRESFLDADTGQPIIGHAWSVSLAESTRALAALQDA